MCACVCVCGSVQQEVWLSPEEDAGTAVEFMVLRRQVSSSALCHSFLLL